MPDTPTASRTTGGTSPSISLRVLPTLNEDGSRRWIRPKVSEGRFLTRRRLVAYFLIVLFTLIPYLKLNGKPLVLLDLSLGKWPHGVLNPELKSNPEFLAKWQRIIGKEPLQG